ncbi:hypothetical protein D3C84_1088160 [compost metagenome]
MALDDLPNLLEEMLTLAVVVALTAVFIAENVNKRDMLGPDVGDLLIDGGPVGVAPDNEVIMGQQTL